MAVQETITALPSLTDGELQQLIVACVTEEQRRRAALSYLADTLPPEQRGDTPLPETGRDTTPPTQPADYAQPTGAHDAYPMGALVTFEGAIYQSLLANNVWSPTAYPRGWRKLDIRSDPDTPEPRPEQPAKPDTPPVVPEFAQPTGAHDAYKKGDKALYKGVVYESVIDANVWAPDAYPQGWKQI